MKYLHKMGVAPALLATLLTTGGCVDTATPTSPLFEQAVFTVLGGLGAGESISLTGSAAAEAIVGGSAVPGEFVFIPFHASQAGGENMLVRVEGENVSSAASAARAPIESDRGAPQREHPDWSMHERLHSRMQREAAPYLERARRNLALGPGDVPAVRTDLSAVNAHVDQIVQLNASVFGPICDAVDNRTGRVEAIGQRSIIVADVNNPAGGFVRADYEAFAQEIDQLVYPTVTRYFGEPTDIDENSRVIVFFTRAVNEMTGPGDTGFVGGFFWGRDLIPRWQCPASNEGEIFFVLVPDPQGRASPIRHTRETVSRGALSTIGHELQHLINASRRAFVIQAPAEELWLDEGLSHSAEELLFYAAAGLEPRGNIGAEVLSSPTVARELGRFMFQNLARYDLYIENVTRNSPIGLRDALELRGAIWSFLRYAVDHSPRTDEEFFRGLVNSGQAGLDNLNSALADTPLDWLQRWGVSVYTDDLVEGDDPLLQQPSWHYRSILPAIFGAFPLAVQSIGSGESRQLELLAGTSGYIRFQGMPGATSRLRTTSAGAPPPNELRVTIVRIR